MFDTAYKFIYFQIYQIPRRKIISQLLAFIVNLRKQRK